MENRIGLRMGLRHDYVVEHFAHFHEDGTRCRTPHDKCRRWHKSISLGVDRFHNFIPNAGLNKYLDAALVTGLSAPAWYVGLFGPSITDGVTTASSGVFTSASNPFVAADVGKNIIVKGAAASGADLVTTIKTYTSAGSVTLNTNAAASLTAVNAAWDGHQADTMSSHSPCVFSTPYSNATRPAWTPGAISNGSVDNSGSKATFNINATANVFGSFMTDSATKAGTTGTLLGMGLFSMCRSVLSGDTITVQVTCSFTLQ